MSPKHLNRYVRECAGKHNVRESDTLDQMREVAFRLMGRTLPYRSLIAVTHSTPRNAINPSTTGRNDHCGTLVRICSSSPATRRRASNTVSTYS